MKSVKASMCVEPKFVKPSIMKKPMKKERERHREIRRNEAPALYVTFAPTNNNMLQKTFSPNHDHVFRINSTILQCTSSSELTARGARRRLAAQHSALPHPRGHHTGNQACETHLLRLSCLEGQLHVQAYNYRCSETRSDIYSRWKLQ